MILQVHDELNFSVPEAEKEIIQKIVIEEMERAYRMLVPLKAVFAAGYFLFTNRSKKKAYYSCYF